MKILSLSGGGFRGLITLVALQKLEVRHGKLNEYFDIIAGTSAGGIIGACLSSGMRVNDIMDLWLRLGNDVFKPNRLRGYANAKYRIEDLERVVKSVLGESLSKGKARLIVTAFDDVTESAMVLKTHDNRHNLTLADFAIATAAAPTYFAPYRTKGFSFIDGGVFSTNPSREALTEALMLGAKPESIDHISIGTGYNKMNINVGNWGVLQWILAGRTPIVRIFMESSSDVAVKTASMIGNYKHFDVPIAREHADMDKPQFASEYLKYGQQLADLIY